MKLEQFIYELKKINIKITDKELNLLEEYYRLLVEKNQTMNLTRITEKEEVYLKHFYDSLTLSLLYNLKKEITLCDVGTGAGFPGIVLKIIFPHLDITLIESSNKKALFLEEIINRLNLKKIKVISTRAEDYARKNREFFDLVVARAVAPLNILIELCLPLVKEEGYFIAMKGENKEDILDNPKYLSILGGRLEEIKYFSLPIEESKRNLIKIYKKQKTNPKYPRKFSQIKKKPL